MSSVSQERKIYTRRGDRGESGLLGGERLSKDDARFEAVGVLDELQSHLGVVRASCAHPGIRSTLYSIQKSLFVAGSELASSSKSLGDLPRRLGPEDTSRLESCIDTLTQRYGLPGGFVVSGRSLESALMHGARAICRRCERRIVALNREENGVYDNLIVFFNRLGDLIFVMAWSLELRALVAEVLGDLLRVARGKESQG